MGLRRLCGERQGWGSSLGPAVKELEQQAKVLDLVLWPHQKERLVVPASGPLKGLVMRGLCELNKYSFF